jgi:hypothetical protein
MKEVEGRNEKEERRAGREREEMGQERWNTHTHKSY